MVRVHDATADSPRAVRDRIRRFGHCERQRLHGRDRVGRTPTPSHRRWPPSLRGDPSRSRRGTRASTPPPGPLPRDGRVDAWRTEPTPTEAESWGRRRRRHFVEESSLMGSSCRKCGPGSGTHAHGLRDTPSSSVRDLRSADRLGRPLLPVVWSARVPPDPWSDARSRESVAPHVRRDRSALRSRRLRCPPPVMAESVTAGA